MEEVLKSKKMLVRGKRSSLFVHQLVAIEDKKFFCACCNSFSTKEEMVAHITEAAKKDIFLEIEEE